MSWMRRQQTRPLYIIYEHVNTKLERQHTITVTDDVLGGFWLNEKSLNCLSVSQSEQRIDRFMIHCSRSIVR